MVAATLLGALLAFGRLSDHAWVRVPVTAVVEFFRAVPLLILILFCLLYLPRRSDGAFGALALGLTLYNMAVLAEIFRAGLLSVDRGQSEAAYALGMRKWQVMLLILMPQAVRRMLPVLIAQLVVLLKDSSLGFIVGYFELLRQARSLVEYFNFKFGDIYTFQLYVAAGLIYIVVNVLLSTLGRYVEKRTRRNVKASATATVELPADVQMGGGGGRPARLIPPVRYRGRGRGAGPPRQERRSARRKRRRPGSPARSRCATMRSAARPSRATCRLRARSERARTRGGTHVLHRRSPPADDRAVRTGNAVVTAIAPQPIISRPSPAHVPVKGSRLSNILRTTDHKTIGLMYLVTSFVFFIAGGLMAMLMRAELGQPGLQFLSPEQYNQLFTMHGTVMLLMFATPLFFAFGNLIMPLQIGSPDVAFPRLNAFSFWLFLFGSLIVMSGFLTPGGPADFGWTAYAPLSTGEHSPGMGGNLWAAGWGSAGSARSSAPSTSRRRSSACGRPG